MKRLALATLLVTVGCSRGAPALESHDAAANGLTVAGMAVARDGVLRATLPNGVRATFETTGVRVGTEDLPSIELRVEELRRGDARLALGTEGPLVEHDRISIDRGAGVSEWWTSKDGRLELGWTLARRPLEASEGPLAIPLAVPGASFEANEGAVVFARGGRFAARLDALEVRDANGERVPARFASLDGRAAIVIDDGAAKYPLTVDPILGVMTQLVASSPSSGFGTRVAIDGDVAAVTAIGTAYVYRRSGGTWSLEATLPSMRNNYNRHLSLSGNTLVVGDVLYDHTSGSWVQVATLPSIESAVSGTTLAVLNDLVSPTYVALWTRGSSGWAATGTLATGTPTHLALNGSVLAVATRSSTSDKVGAVKVYTGSGTSWTLGPTMTPTGTDGYFGSGGGDGYGDTPGLAVTSDTIAILSEYTVTGEWAMYLGSPSSASLQRISLGTGVANFKALDVSSGVAVLGEGGTAVGGKTGAGQVRVFSRSGTTWSERATLNSPLPFNYDYFGHSVSISGEDVLIGSYQYSKGGSVSPTGMAFELRPVLAWSNGHACSLDGECASGLCVDGVCCNTACTESCKACNLAGTTGTCTNVPADSMPVGTRVCAPAKRCAAGGVCATTCTTVSDCAAGGACIGGMCAGKRGNGSPCAAASDCTSNFCVDGVCCDTACTSQCMACDVPTKQGTCWKVTGPAHTTGGLRKACSGPGVGTECTPTCNGSDGSACHYAPTGTVACGSDSCDPTTLIETRRGTCDGAGACSGGSASCGAYACGTTTCKTSCATNADCSKGYVCGTDKLCKAISTLGAGCTKPTDCDSALTCVDGVCCADSSCPTGSFCNLAGSKGQCRKGLGTACTSDAECSAGKTCSDGVCCDKACNGVCEACDVPGKAGTCVPVSGPPRPTRAGCPAGADKCGDKQCDGNARTTCESFATPKGTECEAATCVEGGVQPKSTCDGAGACLTPSVQKCGNYVCADGSCKTSCTKPEDCAAGFVCGPDGLCVEGARCSDDGLSSIAKDGTVKPCAPYRCGSVGLCTDHCASTDECAPGSACDTAAQTCQPSAPGSDDGGGCATSTRGTGCAALVSIALATIAASRRRRVTASR